MNLSLLMPLSCKNASRAPSWISSSSPSSCKTECDTNKDFVQTNIWIYHFDTEMLIWYIWIVGYIRLIQTNLGIYLFDMNKYLNTYAWYMEIFVSDSCWMYFDIQIFVTWSHSAARPKECFWNYDRITSSPVVRSACRSFCTFSAWVSWLFSGGRDQQPKDST